MGDECTNSYVGRTKWAFRHKVKRRRFGVAFIETANCGTLCNTTRCLCSFYCLKMTKVIRNKFSNNYLYCSWLAFAPTQVVVTTSSLDIQVCLLHKISRRTAGRPTTLYCNFAYVRYFHNDWPKIRTSTLSFLKLILYINIRRAWSIRFSTINKEFSRRDTIASYSTEYGRIERAVNSFENTTTLQSESSP